MNTDNKVKEILTDMCGRETINLDDQLQKDLSLDSLMMVMLLLQIEEVFGIELEQSDMNPLNLITVQDVIDMVEKYDV